MLSRTAEGLFWLGRYIERAENLARLLEAGRRLDQLPLDAPPDGSEWSAILVAAGCRDTFPGETESAEAQDAIRHLICGADNPSSIQSCFALARANARAQRIAITTEVWSSANDAWREMRSIPDERFAEGRLAELIDRVRAQAAEFRGAVEGTMLRSEGFDFIRLGEAIERFDATARLLDVKYHVLLPDEHRIGGAYDALQWNHVLRAAGARSAYRWHYRAEVNGEMVVDFLILEEKCPRSLRHCCIRILERLQRLSQDSAIAPGSLAVAERMLEHLQPGSSKRILAAGLHEYLTDRIVGINSLALEIGIDFGFGRPPGSAEQSQSG